MLYMYPNRPSLIPPDKTYINELEDTGQYIAEQKWNGDNTQLITGINEFWNRKKDILRYQPTPEVSQELLKLPNACMINLETVHYHTKTIKNLLIIHCIMVYKGQPLYGKTWQDSRNILETFQYGTHIKLSRIWTKGFWDLYQAADGSIIEGIILKKKTGMLKFSTTPIPDVGYMLKVRHPCAKYDY